MHPEKRCAPFRTASGRRSTGQAGKQGGGSFGHLLCFYLRRLSPSVRAGLRLSWAESNEPTYHEEGGCPMAKASPIIIKRGRYLYEREGVRVNLIAPRDLTLADAGPALLSALEHVRAAEDVRREGLACA